MWGSDEVFQVGTGPADAACDTRPDSTPHLTAMRAIVRTALLLALLLPAIGMPLPAASKQKTFFLKGVELRSEPGRTCQGCAVPGIGNCDHANDEARKAGAISSPGACGYQRLSYVRA